MGWPFHPKDSAGCSDENGQYFGIYFSPFSFPALLLSFSSRTWAPEATAPDPPFCTLLCPVPGQSTKLGGGGASALAFGLERWGPLA